MKIAILGRKQDIENYTLYVSLSGQTPVPTLSPQEVLQCDVLILPGGGDITPDFYGETENGSRNIDTELDILQLQAFTFACSHTIPVLGICKGMQLINVALGGTLFQDLPCVSLHQAKGLDQYHDTLIAGDSLLDELYGPEALVNSAHHQGIARTGKGLKPIQWCKTDHCIEALVHVNLPILGLQWHPERLNPSYTSADGQVLLKHFLTSVNKFF